MVRIARAIVILSLAAAVLPGETKTPETPEGRLTIRLYNYAKVSQATLRRAAEKARSIYEQAGIATEWMECRLSPSDPVKNPACKLYPGPAVLQLRILNRRMAEGAPVKGNVFGYALPAREGEFSNVASVFFHRVGRLAAQTGTAEDVILGHMLAHEAGHLLLGFNSHSKRGLMHIPWRDDDLKRAEIGGLTFLPKQARAMRKDSAKRIAAERQGLSVFERAD